VQKTKPENMSTFRNTTDCISDSRRYVLLIVPKFGCSCLCSKERYCYI